jgi:GNAT superfamily N-acetyltransferase
MHDIIVHSNPLDPLARPLVEDLIREYDRRYGSLFSEGGARDEVYRYPPQTFAAPHGAFLLLVRAGQAVAGGAFMRHDEQTAELKRIWTHAELRRQGLAARVVGALEKHAADLGYTRLYLTTGFRQPEAQGLYLSMGYRPLFDPAIPPELYGTLPFEKHIGRLAGRQGTSPLRKPAASAEEAIAAVAARKASPAIHAGAKA